MPKYNRINIFRFIAQLLHPTASVDACYFPAPQVFWDSLVKLGSRQLVLPAIYGAIKRKKLEYLAPKDLLFYLQEISDLNHERNTAILKQIIFLSNFFNMYQIDHVFLKGAAILIKKPYDAINERMVGDIDILVSEKHLLKAQKLLIKEGFEPLCNEYSFTKEVISENSHKHLKRIMHPNHIAAVEIHRYLLKNKSCLIKSRDVIKCKVQCNGYSIPSKQHLLEHAILNWQYNDSGMILNCLAFRTILDVLYLESKGTNVKPKSDPKAIKHFYSLLSIYYNNYKSYYQLSKLIYKWQLKSIFFYEVYRFFIKLFSFVSFALSRAFLFINSRTYRKNVLNNPKLIITRMLNLWTINLWNK